MIADGGRTEVGGRELASDLVEQIGITELADEFAEIEIIENLAGVTRETTHVIEQIVFDILFAQLGQIHRRNVGKRESRGAVQKLLLSIFGQLHGRNARGFGNHGSLVSLQHALKATQQRKRQNDASVLALLEVTA